MWTALDRYSRHPSVTQPSVLLDTAGPSHLLLQSQVLFWSPVLVFLLSQTRSQGQSSQVCPYFLTFSAMLSLCHGGVKCYPVTKDCQTVFASQTSSNFPFIYPAAAGTPPHKSPKYSPNLIWAKRRPSLYPSLTLPEFSTWQVFQSVMTKPSSHLKVLPAPHSKQGLSLTNMFGIISRNRCKYKGHVGT